MKAAAVLVATSKVDDGSMSKSVALDERDENRRKFLAAHGVTPEQTVLVHLTYGGDNYCRYETATAKDKGDGITKLPSSEHDALFTTEKGLALLLPLADCIGVVLYDAKHHALGLAHLGRHNLVQMGGTRAVTYMQEQFGTEPQDLLVWLSPAAAQEAYPLFDFDNRGMHDVAIQQLVRSGIPEGNIVVDTRDTATDPQLFSHSQFLKGKQETDGRHAMLAMMRD